MSPSVDTQPKRDQEEWTSLQALGKLLEIPCFPSLPCDGIGKDFAEKIPIQFLKHHKIVPLPGLPDGPMIAVNDCAIGTLQACDDVATLLDMGIPSLCLAVQADILSCINQCYDQHRDSAEQIVQDIEEDNGFLLADIEETADLLDDTSDAPVIKLVNHIIAQSTKAGASDIHVEPYQNSLVIRHRVDGVLYDLVAPPKQIQSALISRIKVMAQLNIAEKRLPQDGRINLRIGEQEVDVRVSTLPTTFGERVVLRLLNKSGMLLQLSEIGLDDNRLSRLDALIRSPNGIVLVTGPTGSGKTTTLYAVMSTINTHDINIMTIEDPVEYQLNGISQIQVNPKIDLTFARGLRSIVRQDPDVILVGEIRDHETMAIAIQSALTGHLVFSTLHTNDSAGAITRLVDIGTEPFLISSSVIAVLAQRLTRVLCPACKQPYHPDPSELDLLGIESSALKGQGLFSAAGCPACLQTGYRGRSGIFEMMEMTPGLKSLVLQTSDANAIKRRAVSDGMVTLRQDGVAKLLRGQTSIAEVVRVTQR